MGSALQESMRTLAWECKVSDSRELLRHFGRDPLHREGVAGVKTAQLLDMSGSCIIPLVYC